MVFVCLWSPGWSTAGERLPELGTQLLELAPRVVVEARGVMWVDGRGVSRKLPHDLVSRLRTTGDEEVCAGVSRVPIAAEAAGKMVQGSRFKVQGAGTGGPGTMDVEACTGSGGDGGCGQIVTVAAGEEREFLAPVPLELLEPDPDVLMLMEGVGIRRCGELAALEREAVEVRFGAAGGALWRLARADDPRRLFRPIPPEQPQAAIDFVEFEIRQAERLLFTVNGLLGSVCDGLAARGARAREMVLTLSLSRGGSLREVYRTVRPTADRAVWLRRTQDVLEGLRLPEAVVGVRLEAGPTEPVSAVQGDLFDRGFASAAPVEEAVFRLVDRHGPLLVEPETCRHALVERQSRWRAREPAEASAVPTPEGGSCPRLALQLLREPRPIEVKLLPRRDHRVPVGYRHDGRWRRITAAAGPDRVSGGQWEESLYAREYFRCSTEEGSLLWIFRDALRDAWYVQGWWD